MAKTIKGNGVIDGTELAEIIKGGKGDDIITGGKGNDTITGGTGTNIIIHHKGDGNDIINLTKGENLIIKVDELADKNVLYTESLKYSANKKDVLICLADGEYITLKNYGVKDITNNATKKTEDTSSVLIQVGDDPDNIIDLRKYTESLMLGHITTTTTKNFTGTWLNDNIDASEATKGLKLNGGKGQDYIIGTNYSDTINGGDDDDWIEAGNGNDIIKGGKGDDMLFGEDGNDVIDGGDGDDYIEGGAGNDTITGGKGTNIIAYGVGDGNDVIKLTKGENFILELYGIADDSNVDVCYAENKKDLLVFIDKNNRNEYITIKNFVNNDKTDSAILRIGEENINLKTLMFQKEPTADYTGTVLDDWIDASGYVVEGQTAADRGLVLNAGKGRQNQFVFGSDYSDTIYAGELTEKGDMVFNEIDAGDGNDVIIAGKSNDVIYAGKGNDTITGGAGWNEITYFEGDGHDVINLTKGEQLAISFREDWSNYSKLSNISYEKSENGKDLVIWVDKDNHDKGSITIKNFIIKDTTNNATKKAEDTSFVNLFYADAEGNEVAVDLRKDISILTETDKNFTGTWVNDLIYAGGAYLEKTIKVDGKKQLVEKADTDKGLTLNGGKGNDKIIGTNYSDTLKGGDGNDEIKGGKGNDKIYGGNGNDIIYAQYGNNVIYGEAGDDSIYSGEGNDTIYGGKGNDVIHTAGAQDYVDAGEGDDKIYVGGNGGDTIIGGKGNDVIEVKSEGNIIKFGKNSGHDIYNSVAIKKSDTLVFDKISSKQLSYSKSGDDLVISYNKNTSVTVQDYFKVGGKPEEWGTYVQTKDGKELLFDVVNANILPDVPEDVTKGTVGNDTLSSDMNLDLIYGFYGNDTINSTGLYSTIYGGEGNDVINVEGGFSVVYGDEGNDAITSKSTAGYSTIYGGKGNDTITTSGDYGNNTLVFENGDGNDVIIQSSSEDRKADIIKLMGVDKDGFTQAMSGNDLVISYNKDENGIFQDSITIKDFLKNPDDIPTYKIVTKDGYESTADMAKLKEDVVGWLETYTFDDVASGLESATETQIYELNNAFMTANNEQIIPA